MLRHFRWLSACRPAAAAGAVVCAWACITPAAAQEIHEARLRSHTHVLAHDSLEGRGTASRGERKAARYLVSVIEEQGLVPLPGTDGYRLAVPLLAFPVDDQAATLVVRGASATRTITPPAFYHPGGSVPAFRDFTGAILFAGATPGALDALAPYPDLTGRIVVAGPPWSGLVELGEAILARGAEGIILAIPTRFYDRLRVVRGPTRFALREQVGDRLNQNPLPQAVIGPEGLAALGLAGEVEPGRTVARAQARGVTVDVRHGITRFESHMGYNVAAMVPGSDPDLADEAVLYVAHYDHVGFGEPSNGDSIWNGFVDNAAGTAMLLEVARNLASDPPARSVIFLFTTAEEQGLLGANWFVHRPPFPLERIRAVINVDGGAPPGIPAAFQLAGAETSPAGAVAAQAVTELGYGVTPRPITPDSDHWVFHTAGVPALFLYPGALAGVDADSARALYARWSRPHTPHDEWHPDFPFEGMVHYARAALAIGRRLANEPPHPDDAQDCRAPAATAAVDHVVIAVTDLQSASRTYGELGFTQKEGRLHANGLLNRHLKFRDDPRRIALPWGDRSGSSMIPLLRAPVLAAALCALIAHPAAAQHTAPDDARYDRFTGLYDLEDGRQLVVTDLVDQMPDRAHQLMVLEPASGWVRTVYAVDGAANEFEVGAAFFQRDPVEGRITFSTGAAASQDGIRWTDPGGGVVTGVRAAVRKREIAVQADSVTLAGAVVLPPESVPGPYPALVFVHGSGPLSRRSPLQVGYQMAAAGIAAVVFDKRGTGRSEGAFRPNQVVRDARDAVAVLDHARSMQELDPRRIGLHAASEGGFVAPLVFEQRPDLAALICRVCPVMAWAEALPPYLRLFRLEPAGVPPEEIEEAVAYTRVQIRYALHREGHEELARRYEAGRGSAWQRALGFEAPAPNPPDAPAWDAFRDFLSSDPSPMYRQIAAPVLVILGEADPRVPGPLHAVRARELLAAGSARAWDVWELPNANHGLMEVRAGSEGSGGAPQRYAADIHARLVRWARASLGAR